MSIMNLFSQYGEHNDVSIDFNSMELSVYNDDHTKLDSVHLEEDFSNLLCEEAY